LGGEEVDEGFVAQGEEGRIMRGRGGGGGDKAVLVDCGDGGVVLG